MSASGFGFRGVGLEFTWVPSWPCRPEPGSDFGIWGLGFEDSSFGFRVSGFGFRVSGFGHRGWDSWSGVQGLGFGV